MKLLLRQCTIKDLDQLVKISQKTFIEAFAKQNNQDDFEHYLNTALSKETIASELDHPDSLFYFVMKEDQTIGFLKINAAKAQTDIFDETSYELERIYLLSGYQNLGIGEWMLEEIIQLAQDDRKDFIWLGVWEENIRAIRFYEKMGFVKFGKHPYYIGKDKQMDWLMKLDLTTL